MLQGDDLATAYDPISYQVMFLFMCVFDHVRTFRQALEDHGMPMVAGYPLIRSALESAAQVLWLTTGGTRSKRVFRALHTVWDAASLNDEACGISFPKGDRCSRVCGGGWMNCC